MPKTALHISDEMISRFRLQRHHLSDEEPADATAICRDVCGVQAQVMSSAFLQLWTRNHSVTRAEIENALWQSRTLVKTSLMRQTLHLIPTDEFHVYIAALRSSRVMAALRVMARFGIAREEGESLTPLILEALATQSLARPAIAAAIRPRVSKRVRLWMENSWSAVRVPIAEGLICYGSGEANEITFTRTDRWLSNLKLETLSETEAQCALFRKYLRAYGPATATDFSHWSGIPMQQVKAIADLLDPEMEKITSEKRSLLLLRGDVAVLKGVSAENEQSCVRLLPSFDIFLLAHRAKNHLLSEKYYKRVYRNQGWISPVVLVDGAVAGIWSHESEKKRLQVKIEAFGKLSRAVRTAVAREAERLADYFARDLTIQFV
jgi:hypothetical protein